MHSVIVTLFSEQSYSLGRARQCAYYGIWYSGDESYKRHDFFCSFRLLVMTHELHLKIQSVAEPMQCHAKMYCRYYVTLLRNLNAYNNDATVGLIEKMLKLRQKSLKQILLSFISFCVKQWSSCGKTKTHEKIVFKNKSKKTIISV